MTLERKLGKGEKRTMRANFKKQISLTMYKFHLQNPQGKHLFVD